MPTHHPITLLTLAVTLLATPAAADWPAYADGDDVCLVIHELESGREYVSDADRCNEPRRPYSTFKIPNALLGLETGLLADADSVMRYNAARYPAEDWWPAGWDRDQPLRRAINMSAVPLFRQLAADIGPARLQAFLRDIDYGNADIGGEADAFWLTGDLRISAVEQVEFLTRLATGRLQVSAESVAAIRDALGREVAAEAVLYTKTGSGRIEGDGASGFLGWQVGWVERDDEVTVFAFWTEAETYQLMRSKRQEFLETFIGRARLTHRAPADPAAHATAS
ncbi:penicillin-binding transpeptidase domain-containing protein [Lentisalinibacter orientalis]|uniref:penicillin-binding transpeptidase domain-containing protein n=1 Tax=Lentisalinibacter orientalis TaxID=2992241 RepID=UPI00386F899C